MKRATKKKKKEGENSSPYFNWLTQNCHQPIVTNTKKKNKKFHQNMQFMWIYDAGLSIDISHGVIVNLEQTFGWKQVGFSVLIKGLTRWKFTWSQGNELDMVRILYSIIDLSNNQIFRKLMSFSFLYSCFCLCLLLFKFNGGYSSLDCSPSLKLRSFYNNLF